MRSLRAAICLIIVHQVLTVPATAISSVLQHHQQQHAFANRAVLRELLEQILFTPADVQLVVAHMPVLFPSGTYLQIGANTMDNPNDPFLVQLEKYNNHRKVFVEPIPALFQKLKQNLASMANTTFINAAVNSATEGDADEAAHDSKATAVMFCVQSDKGSQANATQLPFWADQICSFSRDHISKLLPQARVSSFEVESLTVRQMLHQHDISDVLVVLIDTEGFDWQVVRQLPLHRASFRPVLIGFEHQHLSRSDLAAATNFLHGHGYAVIHDAQTFNTFALSMV